MIINDVELSELEKKLENTDSPEKKLHPWRRCPIGKHLVREHIVHVHPSKTHPSGHVATWHEHCANNPSHKDELSHEEISHIDKTYFPNLIGLPAADVLVEFDNADKYDQQIRGWVRYWNDIFHPDDQLNPNLIKALIATESSFNPDPKKN